MIKSMMIAVASTWFYAANGAATPPVRIETCSASDDITFLMSPNPKDFQRVAKAGPYTAPLDCWYTKQSILKETGLIFACEGVWNTVPPEPMQVTYNVWDGMVQTLPLCFFPAVWGHIQF
jgi:hypothetical protein